MGTKTTILSVLSKRKNTRSKRPTKNSPRSISSSKKQIGPGPAKADGPGPKDQPRESSRPKTPTQPPMNRKPTVSSSSGSDTIVEQIAPIWVITLEATVVSSPSNDSIAVTSSVKILLSIYPRESRRPNTPTQPPMNRKPTVSSSNGWDTMVVQIVPINSRHSAATVPRFVSSVDMVFVKLPPYKWRKIFITLRSSQRARTPESTKQEVYKEKRSVIV